MSDDEKNAISHRAKAVHELMAQVKSHGIVFAKP
jgi:inosine/xanthosine triphosphate pyrophosphatase family protein